MRLWFSRRVQKNPVYLAYTDFRVLQKRRKGANYRRFYDFCSIIDFTFISLIVDALSFS